jgi:hypothetical protein
MEARPMITRYAMSWATDEDEFVYVSPIESAKGNWVKYEDYARLQQERVHDLNQIGGLQQELARLRASSFVTAVPVEQYERVVKAGDAVCESPYLWENDPAVIAWRAAKEGKPIV